MLVQDIPKVFINDNVYLAYWEGNLQDDGCRPCDYKRAFDFNSIKEYVEKGSYKWSGNMYLKWMPMYPVKEGEFPPDSLSFKYNGYKNSWTDLDGKEVDFNITLEELGIKTV